jgi:hypothetical protein
MLKLGHCLKSRSVDIAIDSAYKGNKGPVRQASPKGTLRKIQFTPRYVDERSESVLVAD